MLKEVENISHCLSLGCTRWPPSKGYSVGREGESKFTLGSLTDILSQVIGVNINKDKTYGYHILFIGCDVMKVVLYFWLLPPPNPQFNTVQSWEKTLVKSQLRVMRQNIWRTYLQTFEVIKNRIWKTVTARRSLKRHDDQV